MARRSHLFPELLGIEANPFSDTAIADGTIPRAFDPTLHPGLVPWMAKVFLGAPQLDSRPVNFLWSLGSGNEARGYGKSSYLLWIERSINSDLGAAFSQLGGLEAHDQARLLAAYTSFSTVDAMSLSGVLYAATKGFLTGHHEILIKLREGYYLGGARPSDLHERCRKIASTSSEEIDARLLSRLVYGDANGWQGFFRHKGLWHRQRWGRRIFGSLIAFTRALGIPRFLLLIDQVEDFTGSSPSFRHYRDFGRLAEIAVSDRLFRDVVRVVLALHPRAEFVTHWCWRTDKLGPFPGTDDPARCVVIGALGLEGVTRLIRKCLSSVRVTTVNDDLAPFTIEAVHRIHMHSGGRPSTVVTMCYELLEEAISQKLSRVEPALVDEVFG